MPWNESELRHSSRMRNRLLMMDAERLSKGSSFRFVWITVFVVSFAALLVLTVLGWEA